MKSNQLIIGILAHVDAGKTTLSEGILYLSGSIKKMGRVDHRDTFFDTDERERERGITIFSKQAELKLEDMQITLLDTPGHVDFSAEMERTLQVLDYAILVINGADGVQSHTMTLWNLLKAYQIPVFLFINKMDQAGTDKQQLLMDIQGRLDDRCVDFEWQGREAFYDALAMCSEELMETYLESGEISQNVLSQAIYTRDVFPCFFGSALKMEGVREFLEGLTSFMQCKEYPEQFGAKIYKITRDGLGNRLTHMKITGGVLKVKEYLENAEKSWKEKVNEIRIYSGEEFHSVQEADAGTVCVVMGLSQTKSGEGLGRERHSFAPLLEPVLIYRILTKADEDMHVLRENLKQLEEENPQLHIVWNEELGELHVQVMGEIEISILKSLIWERFGSEIDFGTGSIVYKETIEEAVEGVGHFEPLRHYAEVHLRMEPGKPGSGLVFASKCSEDVLSRNWQRLILTHLREKKHKGVLTGSEITDMKITLVSGKAHLKHTEGGDFRQATYRAVRHGLKKAGCILLEPVYQFQLEVPTELVGRALSDIQRMHGEVLPPEVEGDFSVVKGSAPVVCMRSYQMELNAYAKGRGKLFCSLKGYEPCHNAEEVIEQSGYDSERDAENPTGSVFCSHGSGFLVKWEDVEKYMHVENQSDCRLEMPINLLQKTAKPKNMMHVDEKELEEIFNRTYGIAKQEKPRYAKNIRKRMETVPKVKDKKCSKRDKYLLVDGYNIIFAWEELQELAKDNLDGARYRLMDILCNYQGFVKDNLILVFDAYKVKGNPGSVTKYHNIHVIYTKEAETADQYIEKAVHEMGKRYDVTVATSDYLEQMIIWGDGAKRLSAAGLKKEVEEAEKQMYKYFQAAHNNLI